jgi:hypothetical protein
MAGADGDGKAVRIPADHEAGRNNNLKKHRDSREQKERPPPIAPLYARSVHVSRFSHAAWNVDTLYARPVVEDQPLTFPPWEGA